MPTYTFEVKASVSIEADTEDQARKQLAASFWATELNMPYGDGMVHIPPWEMDDAELTDIENELI